MFNTVKASPYHAATMLPDIRTSDRDEWIAAGGSSLLELMVGSIQATALCYTAVETRTGAPIMMWGVNPTPDQKTGIGWLIATNRAVDVAYPLHRLVLRKSITELHETWPVIRAFSDERNKVHHEWMSVLGFDLVDRLPQFGTFGLPFYIFEKRKDDTHVR